MGNLEKFENNPFRIVGDLEILENDQFWISVDLEIEVRDSRTGYFIPVHYGLGLLPDEKIVGAPSSPSASSGNSGGHSGQETIFGVFHMVLGSW